MKRLSILAAIVVCVVIASTMVHQARHSAQAVPGVLSHNPWGDVNCSTEANSIDAVLILQTVAGFEVTLGCPHLGDVNGSGAMDVIDAALILQYEAGLIDDLTPPLYTCDPCYPTICVLPPPPDLDCGDIAERNFPVVGDDSHGFDDDGDGIGCET